MIKALWSDIEKRENMFCVCFKDTIVIEAPNEENSRTAILNLFLNKESAIQYRTFLSEKYDYRPSGLFVRNMKIEDILSDKGKLTEIADRDFNCNIKIVVSEFNDDGDVLESNVLFDSSALLN